MQDRTTLLGIEEHVLWLGAAALAAAMLVAAFGWVLVQRHHNWLLAGYRKVDAWLTARWPRSWRLLKHRFDPKTWYGLALTAAMLTTMGSIYLFAAVTENWRERGVLYAVDRVVQQSVAGAMHPALVDLFRLVTHFGDLIAAVVVTAGLAIYFYRRRLRWYLLALMLTMVGGEAVVWTMKALFARERPGDALVDAVGRSFPSGHTFTATALYGFLIFLVWRFGQRASLRTVLTGALSVLILLVGLSRIVLGVHWTSDVLGGFIIGLGWLVFSLVAAKAIETRRTRHQ